MVTITFRAKFYTIYHQNLLLYLKVVFNYDVCCCLKRTFHLDSQLRFPSLEPMCLNMIVHLKKTDSKLNVVFDDNMKFRSYLSSYHNHVHNDVRHHCTCKCGAHSER